MKRKSRKFKMKLIPPSSVANYAQVLLNLPSSRQVPEMVSVGDNLDPFALWKLAVIVSMPSWAPSSLGFDRCVITSGRRGALNISLENFDRESRTQRKK